MDIKDHKESNPDAGWKYELTFTKEETFVLRAMYREKVHRLAGTAQLPAELDILMSIGTAESAGILTNRFDDIIEDLSQFHSVTNGAVQGIASRVDVPYLDKHAGERHYLGKKAKELSDEIKEISAGYVAIQQELESGASVRDIEFMSGSGIDTSQFLR
jgi:hypothetical protein